MKTAASGGAVGCWEIRKARASCGRRHGGAGVGHVRRLGCGPDLDWSQPATTGRVGTKLGGRIGFPPPAQSSSILTSPNPTVLGVGGPAVGTTGGMIVGTYAWHVWQSDNPEWQHADKHWRRISYQRRRRGPMAQSRSPGAGSQWLASGGSIEVGAGGDWCFSTFRTAAQLSLKQGSRSGPLRAATGTLNINSSSTLETNKLSRAATGDG